MLASSHPEGHRGPVLRPAQYLCLGLHGARADDRGREVDAAPAVTQPAGLPGYRCGGLFHPLALGHLGQLEPLLGGLQVWSLRHREARQGAAPRPNSEKPDPNTNRPSSRKELLFTVMPAEVNGQRANANANANPNPDIKWMPAEVKGPRET